MGTKYLMEILNGLNQFSNIKDIVINYMKKNELNNLINYI